MLCITSDFRHGKKKKRILCNYNNTHLLTFAIGLQIGRHCPTDKTVGKQLTTLAGSYK